MRVESIASRPRPPETPGKHISEALSHLVKAISQQDAHAIGIARHELHIRGWVFMSRSELKELLR